MRTITIILLAYWAFASCATRSNKGIVSKPDSMSFEMKLGIYFNENPDTIIAWFHFYDTICIKSLGLKSVRFERDKCEQNSWNKGIILMDTVTSNAYVFSYSKPAPTCHYEIIYDKAVDNVNNGHFNDASKDVYKRVDLTYYSKKIEAYLNNTSIGVRKNIGDQNLDSLFRYSLIIPNNFSPLDSIVKINSRSALDAVFEAFHKQRLSFYAAPGTYQKKEYKQVENFHYFLDGNISTHNFFIYKIPFNRLFVITVNEFLNNNDHYFKTYTNEQRLFDLNVYVLEGNNL